MKLYFLTAVVLAMALALPLGFAQEPSSPSSQRASTNLLPEAFGGWQRSGSANVSTRAADADAVYAGLLAEYGFESFHQATYEKPDRKLQVKAIRFRDTSGAYGAFTFYKQPAMLTESIGDQASSANTRVLFYRSNILVDATLDRVTASSAGELRELASSFQVPPGPERHPPILPSYLPKQYYVANSAKYVTGPLGLDVIGVAVSPDLVNLAAGAEVATGKYHADWGIATLTLISYPTPQIAAERLSAIESAMPVQQGSRSAKIRVASKRTGPIVGVVTGDTSPDEARGLLGLVNFDADVTWNERVPTARDNPGSLLWSLVILTGIILGMSLVAGLAFGGARILIKKLYPNRVFDRQEDIEIIQLNLR